MSRIDKIAYMKIDTGKEIKKRRKALNLTQEDVAKRLGVSFVAVGHWENNRNTIIGKHLLGLAEILQCSPRDLLNGGELSEDDLLEIEANLIRDAYKNSSKEFQEAARRFFGVESNSQKETPE